ncbi:hypothetical protein VNO77_27341 [Canavalia gladiata]|uniref:Uncharacterized protein n=1 Tax=Canavalia gladiata TaxID=3824 RepID=A0AAN9KTZ0_CANGL
MSPPLDDNGVVSHDATNGNIELEMKTTGSSSGSSDVTVKGLELPVTSGQISSKVRVHWHEESGKWPHP